MDSSAPYRVHHGLVLLRLCLGLLCLATQHRVAVLQLLLQVLALALRLTGRGLPLRLHSTGEHRTHAEQRA